MRAVAIYEYAPYADEYTLFGYLDRLLQECEDHGLQMTVVQGGADGADAMAREWAVLNKEIGSGQVELITDPSYFIACRLKRATTRRTTVLLTPATACFDRLLPRSSTAQARRIKLLTVPAARTRVAKFLSKPAQRASAGGGGGGGGGGAPFAMATVSALLLHDLRPTDAQQVVQRYQRRHWRKFS